MKEEDFIFYDDLYKILNDKYNITHDELRYWIKNYNGYGFNYNNLAAYVSDIPEFGESFCRKSLHFCEKFNPIYSMFIREKINSLNPGKLQRFVYIKDLSGQRNWVQYNRSETNYHSNYPALDQAAANGMLRFYDRELDQFTLYQKSLSGNSKQDKLWIETDEGQHYITQPDNFFLLQDIINIERIFFKRPRKDCLEELHVNKKDI